jgi:hypothetical protein
MPKRASDFGKQKQLPGSPDLPHWFPKATAPALAIPDTFVCVVILQPSCTSHCVPTLHAIIPVFSLSSESDPANLDRACRVSATTNTSHHFEWLLYTLLRAGDDGLMQNFIQFKPIGIWAQVYAPHWTRSIALAAVPEPLHHGCHPF